MGKYRQGTFQPQNPAKYVGKHLPVYRSGWELTVMRMFDTHPNVVQWASESHQIPYMHPIKGKRSMYVPDFFVVYIDDNGKQHAEMIEVKPSSQILGEAKGQYDKAQAVVNDAKWKAARQFCQNYGVAFRIITEQQIYNKPKKPTARRGPRKKKK